MKSTLLSLIVFLGMGLLLPVAEARSWKSSDGDRIFEGELNSYDATRGKVTVVLKNRRKLTFNQDKLSEEDVVWLKKNGNRSFGGSSLKIGELPKELPDPDGQEADMSKPVQVFIMLGQSNMLGFGKAGQLKGIAADKYPYLVDDGGEWNVRKDVHNTFFCMAKLQHNDWLIAENGNGGGNFGPEIGIGNYLGKVIDAPVLLLKSCVGNRALGWDLLSPSAVGAGSGGQSYQGDSESLNRKVKEKKDGWYAGLQYDQGVGAAQDALKNLSTYYPGAEEYEVAGFFAGKEMLRKARETWRLTTKIWPFSSTI